MDYTDLRQKTILDFTDDPVILNKIIGKKDVFLKYLNDMSRLWSLLDYADYIKDNALKAAVEKEFEPELSAFFNE